MMSQALMVLVGTLIAVLTVDVVSAMPPRGSWAAFIAWAGLGTAALSVVATAADVPLPVAALLLVLALLVWRQRSRLRWAAKRGRVW